MIPKNAVRPMNNSKNKLTKIIHVKCTPRVRLGSAYFVKTENFLLKVL